LALPSYQLLDDMNISAESALVMARLRPPFARSAYVLFRYASEGKVNAGITFEMSAGEPGVAPGAGTVTKIYTALPDWQTSDPVLSVSTVKHIVIDHGNKVTTLLGGFTTLNIVQGQVVNRGDKLGDLFTNQLFFSISIGGKTFNPCAISPHWSVQNGVVVTGQSGKIRFAPDTLVRDLSGGVNVVASDGVTYFSSTQLLINVAFNGTGSKAGPAAVGQTANDYWNVYTPVAFTATPSSVCSYAYSVPDTAVNTAPTAYDQEISTNENEAVDFILTGSDFETAPENLIFTVTVAPYYGTLSGSAPNLTYTPNAGFFGQDAVAFTVTDDDASPLTSAEGLIFLTVHKYPPQEAPYTIDQILSTDENVPLVLVLTGGDSETITANLVFAVTTLPAHGALAGTPPNLTYTPNTSYTGTDSFEFSVTDDGVPPLTSIVDGLIQIVVNPVVAANTPPYTLDQILSTDQGVAKVLVLTGGDAETIPGNLVYAVTTSPSHGTLTGAPPNLTYTPGAGYFGTDSFEFSVTDDGTPNLTSPVDGLIQIAINHVVGTNTPPIADNQSVSTDQATRLPIALTGSDLETPPAFLTFSVTVLPAHGSLIGTGSSVTYIPNGTYQGADAFRFTTTDTGAPPLTSAAGTVSITVNPVTPPEWPVPTPFPCAGRATTINSPLSITDSMTFVTNVVMAATGFYDPITYLATFAAPGCLEAWGSAVWNAFVLSSVPYTQARLIWEDSNTTGANWAAIQVFPDLAGGYNAVFPLGVSTKIVVEYCPP
jgi:hypothetical protein